jgi:hypothetical protein
VDKIRKILERLWYNKERIVFVVLVGVFCWNMYKVLNPEKDPDLQPHPQPKNSLDGQSLAINVPPPPETQTSAQWATVYTPNPFWYFSGGSKPESDGTKKKDEPEIELVRIQKVGDKYRAQIHTVNQTQWYDENEEFESFVLLKISPEDKSCQVRSEGSGRVITLRIP